MAFFETRQYWKKAVKDYKDTVDSTLCPICFNKCYVTQIFQNKILYDEIFCQMCQKYLEYNNGVLEQIEADCYWDIEI